MNFYSNRAFKHSSPRQRTKQTKPPLFPSPKRGGSARWAAETARPPPAASPRTSGVTPRAQPRRSEVFFCPFLPRPMSPTRSPTSPSQALWRTVTLTLRHREVLRRSADGSRADRPTDRAAPAAVPSGAEGNAPSRDPGEGLTASELRSRLLPPDPTVPSSPEPPRVPVPPPPPSLGEDPAAFPSAPATGGVGREETLPPPPSALPAARPYLVAGAQGVRAAAGRGAERGRAGPGRPGGGPRHSSTPASPPWGAAAGNGRWVLRLVSGLAKLEAVPVPAAIPLPSAGACLGPPRPSATILLPARLPQRSRSPRTARPPLPSSGLRRGMPASAKPPDSCGLPAGAGAGPRAGVAGGRSSSFIPLLTRGRPTRRRIAVRWGCQGVPSWGKGHRQTWGKPGNPTPHFSSPHGPAALLATPSAPKGTRRALSLLNKAARRVGATGGSAGALPYGEAVGMEGLILHPTLGHNAGDEGKVSGVGPWLSQWREAPARSHVCSIRVASAHRLSGSLQGYCRMISRSCLNSGSPLSSSRRPQPLSPTHPFIPMTWVC